MDKILITVTIFSVHLKFARYTGYSGSYMPPSRGGSRGGSLGSDEPPFLAIYPVLSMGSSVRSNFKEPP